LVGSDKVLVEKRTKIKLKFLIINGILILITVYLFLFYIREKKRKKELLEWQFRANLIDGIPIPIAVRDDKSRFIHYNKAFAEFSSLKNPEQILGKKTSEYPSRLIDNTFFKNEEKEYLELLKSKSHGQKIIKLTIENRELTLRFWWVPYVIDSNITGLITGWVDLTEINYLNDQLIKSRDEAINANKDKSNFLAVMSHEIRTPLNAILGTLELSLLNVNERDRYLKQAYDSSLGLLDIVNYILEISKLEVSEKDLTLTYIEVATLLNNVATSFLGLCNKKSRFKN
ncbi:histidine kinase dimerization/phospho-acceptor domain-containing protein, partial [Vibrio aestuarianus]|uniref:histidine kinase dimerization/phospho-acceptor domain-containing protein n=1 Tax=Vibrio aestuarianus TaxID=28171 RepID=UPI0021C2B7BB